MNDHRKKMIAPIVATVLMLLYFALYFVLLMTLDGIGKWLLGAVMLLFAVVMVKVCIERIHEIRKGEEDDLGKY